MADENSNVEFAQLLEEFSRNFDDLCQKRHEAGVAEYGQFTFMGNDVIRMMMEELADTTNYCRMQFIKLMFLQTALEDDLTNSGKVDENDNITIGVQSFKGAKRGWE